MMMMIAVDNDDDDDDDDDEMMIVVVDDGDDDDDDNEEVDENNYDAYNYVQTLYFFFHSQNILNNISHALTADMELHNNSFSENKVN